MLFARNATLQTYNSDLTVLEANRHEKSHVFGTESYSTITREDKGDRERMPHTQSIPWVIRLELFLESG